MRLLSSGQEYSLVKVQLRQEPSPGREYLIIQNRLIVDSLDCQKMDSRLEPTRALSCMLFDVFSPLDKTDPTHHMVPVFDTEDLPDFFRDSDSSSRYDFSKERNVFLIDLYWQSDRSGTSIVGQ